jgi:hypothetical protein
MNTAWAWQGWSLIEQVLILLQVIKACKCS